MNRSVVLSMAMVAIALAATTGSNDKVQPSKTSPLPSTEVPVVEETTGDPGELVKDRRRHGRLLKNILIAKIPTPQIGMMMPKAIFTAGVAMKNSGGGWGGGGGVGWGGGGGGWGGGGGGGWGGGWGAGRGVGGGGGGPGWGWGGGGWGGGVGLGGGGGGWGGPGGGGWGGWSGWGEVECKDKKAKKAEAKAKKQIAKAIAKAEKKAAKGGGGGGGWSGGGWSGPIGGGGGWGGDGGGGGWSSGGNGGGGWGGSGGGGWGGGGGGGIGGGWGGGKGIGGGKGVGGGGGWRSGGGGGGHGNNGGGSGGNGGWRSLPEGSSTTSPDDDEVWPDSPPRTARIGVADDDNMGSDSSAPITILQQNEESLQGSAIQLLQLGDSQVPIILTSDDDQGGNPLENLLATRNVNGVNVADFLSSGPPLSQQQQGLPQSISLRLVCGSIPGNPSLCVYVRS